MHAVSSLAINSLYDNTISAAGFATSQCTVYVCTRLMNMYLYQGNVAFPGDIASLHENI